MKMFLPNTLQPAGSRSIESIGCVILLLACLLVAPIAQAELLTVKRVHTIKDFQTFNGQIIPEVKIGWESYGTLNAAKDNVILITHYFTGSSHAAGKYSPDDANAGYWDSIIGPGKAIDTNTFFVISVDTLANLGVNDPNVVTTGPATINPKTGKHYGLDFPVLTIRDFVNSQKSVLESLGIQRLHAVVGASMGSMQAMEWASAYPERVDHVISVIGSVHSDAWSTTALEFWALPIKLDPAWQNGNYYGTAGPVAGLTTSLMAITHVALHPEYFNQVGAELGHTPLESGPLNDIRQDHKITQWLTQRAQGRASMMDANHLLYLVRACQLFLSGQRDTLEQGLNNVTAEVLFIPANNDLLLMPYHARNAFDIMQAQGKSVSIAALHGPLGHLNGVLNIKQHADTIRDFLRPNQE
jgi:homoserine O-acetyltransferase